MTNIAQQASSHWSLTDRLEFTARGTRVTVPEEGYVGRSEAACANAERWEHVLGWLAVYVESGKSKPDT